MESYVKCEICGKQMKHRINGSHLKRAHDISLKDYLIQFPDADVGQYRCSDFTCKICDETMKGNSEIIGKHLRSHGYSSRHEYNQEFEERKLCKCDCGEYTEYSFPTSRYNDYIEGHWPGWNTGLTKENDLRMAAIWSKKFLWTQIDNERNREIRAGVIAKTIENYANGKIDIEKRTAAYKKTMLENYGVDNYFSTEEFQVRIRARNMDLYGVEHQMQDPIFYERNRSFRIAYKEVVGPNGKIFKVQGYEDLALEILFTQYHENDILDRKSEIPKFMYFSNERNRRYFPDFYIPIENKIIEVKSWWTFEQEDCINEKEQSVMDLGYKYEIWIFNNRKDKELTIL